MLTSSSSSDDAQSLPFVDDVVLWSMAQFVSTTLAAAAAVGGGEPNLRRCLGRVAALQTAVSRDNVVNAKQ